MSGIKVYQTTRKKEAIRLHPMYAPRRPGAGDQWLGEGFYFWQELEFAHFWGKSHVCKNNSQYEIYSAKLLADFKNDERFLDLVYDEAAYKRFEKIIDDFGTRYYRLFKKTPELSDFNDFAQDQDIWHDILAIRFNDNPTHNNYNSLILKIKGIPYKKRIQIVVFELSIISNFVRLSVNSCK